jgi:hypothetical protein
MSRRTPETLADYLVVAIAPALIMLLVGSLVFFLIEVMHHGQFRLRLMFVMAMFILGAVCIARIAMEEGQAYASMYAMPLGVLVGIAVARFVPVNPVMSWGLMALIWWATHKLVWDSTLIDDSRDASGAGLLQQMGIDPDAPPIEGPQPEATNAQSAAQPEATTNPEAAFVAWWQSWVKPDTRPHTPGVWVVYFSLAALPLFGIGGLFLPAGDLETKRRCFWLLVIYVASGLLLLLATSFLGLRKYLRQRRLEMPLEMAASWVGVGLALVAATLVFASLLPRPSPEYSLAHLIDLESLDRQASRLAFGPEGAKEDPNQPSSSAADRQEGQEADREGGQPSETQDKGGESGSSPSGDSQSGEPKSGDSQQSSSQSAPTKGESSKAGESKAGTSKTESSKTESSQTGESPSQSQTNQSSAQQSADQQGGSKSGNSKSPDRSASPGKGKGQQDQSEPNKGEQQPTGAESGKSNEPKRGDEQSGQNELERTKSPPPARSPSRQPQIAQQLSNWFGSLGGLIKLLFYAALAVAVGVLAWRYRAELASAWKKLLAELTDLWNRWFGGRKAATAGEPASPIAQPPRPFAAFADPFASGAAARMSPPEVVRYTFQALEAWGRENGCQRETGQTAHEYAAAIGQLDHSVSREAGQLAELYARLAYAPPAAIRTSFEPLRSLWQKMRSPAAEIVSIGPASD